MGKDTVRNQASREQALEDQLYQTRDELHEAKKRLERSENLHEESKKRDEVQDKILEESKKRDEVHDQKLNLFSKITRSDGHSVMTDVFVSIGVVFICGILVLVFQKSRN